MRGSKPMDALRTLPERAFRLRARLIAVGLCAVCFAGLIGRLFWLQLCTGGWYTQRALGQQLRDTVVPADRGKIYSADGALLAANSSCWTLRASPREMPEEKLALAAKGLAEILELDEAKLLEKFNDRRSNDCLLRYRVERDTADRVRDFCEENGITGIRINQDSKRWYPEGEFLASVLGFTNVDNAGVSGLELKYNDVLTGQNGVVLTAVNAWGYTLEQSYETEKVPLEGSGLRLTVDANIQHYLENALDYAVKEHHVAARAVGIVMDVNTGAVLAMSTTPAYDPNQPRVIYDAAARKAVDALTGSERAAALQLAQQTQWRNKAVSDQISRLCFDGVSKIPVYVMPVLTKMIRDDADLERLAFFIAAYRHYLKHGKDDRGRAYEVNEPWLTEEDRKLIAGDDPVDFLGLSPFRSTDLKAADKFVSQYRSMVEGLEKDGVLSVLEKMVLP